MKNKLRVILFVGMIVAVGVSAIATYRLKSPEQKVKAEMEIRYDEKLKVVEILKEKSSENSKSFKLKGKYGVFTCTKYFDDQKSEHFQDNYLGVKYEKDITSLVEGIFPKDCKVSIDLDKSIYAEVTNPTKISMEEFLNEPTTYIAIDVKSPNEWSDEQVLELEDKLRGKIKPFCNITWDGGSYYFTVTPQGTIVDTNKQVN